MSDMKPIRYLIALARNELGVVSCDDASAALDRIEAEIERLQRLIGDAAARMRDDYCCNIDGDTPAQRMAFIECLEAEANEASDV